MVDDYYNDISEGYEELHKDEQLAKIALIQQHFSVSSEEKLLDVGCGTGITTYPWDCKKYGIDPAQKLLDKALAKEGYHNIEFRCAAAELIPFEDGFFDVVVSITAIQNFGDIQKGLEEIKRVGKNRFVLTFLKRSDKRDEIDMLIKKLFSVTKFLEEAKDFVYIIESD